MFYDIYILVYLITLGALKLPILALGVTQSTF